MKIRLAMKEDLPNMRKIFEHGRQIQLESGNLTQWEEGYPQDALILEDIENGAAHLCLNEENQIVALFSVFTEPDPTYKAIEGTWLNDEDYATIHRIASTGLVSGAGQQCIEWVQSRWDNVRIDTHQDNQQMKHILNKLDFEYCGIIYLANGDPRNAYHYEKNI